MQKNVASQKWVVFAFQDEGGANPGNAVTGDAANITANVRIDGGAANAVDDLNPTELEDGYYVFDITAAESNGEVILIAPASSTANTIVIGVPGVVYTTPANFPDASIEASTGRVDVAAVAGTAQTANDNGADINTLITQVGTAGDGLTAINLPNQTMDITGDITGNLSGSVGSVTGAVGSVTAEVSADVTKISGDATAADNLEASLETMLVGTATGGTTSTVTSAVTGHGDDTFIGRVLIFRTGTCQYEAGTITDYDSTAGTFTFAASTWTTNPTTETFVIV